MVITPITVITVPLYSDITVITPINYGDYIHNYGDYMHYGNYIHYGDYVITVITCLQTLR